LPATGLGRAYVFSSLADDTDLLDAPPGDKFVAIRPARFPVHAATAAGGGVPLTGFDSAWRIAVFGRIQRDQEFRNGQWLRASDGPLSLLWSIVRADQMLTPVDLQGRCLLREPGRLTGFELDAKKLTGKGGQFWSVIPTWWDLKFTAEIS
jgi:hypothetical protein